jgi:peptidoglycan hydrolase CwlO-like protein
MKTKILSVAFFLAFLFLADSSYAQNRPTGTPPVRRGLAEENLRSCEARQEGLKTRMMSLVRLSSNIKLKFDSISLRVQNYYTDTVVPGGNAISNYDELISEIESKKEDVQTELDAVQDQVDAFECSGDDPKGALNQYRLGMQKVKTGLHAYRLSIKNLIVAVRSQVSDNGESPVPAETP